MLSSDDSVISSIVKVSHAHSAASTAATPNNQQLAPARAATAQHSDTVSISPAAARVLEQERQQTYALKTDPMEFYNEWLASSPRYMSLPAPRVC